MHCAYAYDDCVCAYAYAYACAYADAYADAYTQFRWFRILDAAWGEVEDTAVRRGNPKKAGVMLKIVGALLLATVCCLASPHATQQRPQQAAPLPPACHTHNSAHSRLLP